jgi:hypothetical protein
VSDTKTDQFAPTDYRAQLHGSQARERGLVVERDALRADLAKAQARCAELEAALRYAHGELADGKSGYDAARWMTATDKAARALASDGTSALAAVRLAQRALREHPDLGDHKVALKALAEAFGSGE